MKKTSLTRTTLALLFTLQQCCFAWVQPPTAQRGFLVARGPPTGSSSSCSTTTRTTTARFMVESMNVKNLGIEDVGEELAGSVQRWLDFEWMEQELHVKLGESCKASYIKCRQEGQDDLMVIMMAVVDDLTENWKEYDKDAFVNAWDISNYVSDFLTEKTGVEGCGCSSTIH